MFIATLVSSQQDVRPSAFACKLCVKNKINFFFPILNAHWTGMDYTNALVPKRVKYNRIDPNVIHLLITTSSLFFSN